MNMFVYLIFFPSMFLVQYENINIVKNFGIFRNDEAFDQLILILNDVKNGGNGIDNFLKALKTNKSTLLNEVAQFEMPVITVSK